MQQLKMNSYDEKTEKKKYKGFAYV